jgi:osmotically inducible lipoprotein OsmB
MQNPRFRATLMIAALTSSVTLSACATSDPQLRGAGRGAAIGAAGGAVVGAITGGDVVEGAAIGAAGGAVIGAVTADKGNRCERDRNGDRVCYDRDGRRYYPR